MEIFDLAAPLRDRIDAGMPVFGCVRRHDPAGRGTGGPGQATRRRWAVST